MAIVPDIPSIVLLHPIEGDKHKTKRVEPARNGDWNEKHGNTASREHQDMRKNDAANATRSAVSPVFMMPMNIEREQVPADHGAKINQQKMCLPQEHLHWTAEAIETD